MDSLKPVHGLASHGQQPTADAPQSVAGFQCLVSLST